MREYLAAGLLLLGGVFMLLASLGVLRLPDLFMRMQAATKAGTLGIGLVLLSVVSHFADMGVTTRAILVIVFLFLTMPVAAHRIARSAYFVGVPLWSRSVRDDLRGQYHPETHALNSEVPLPGSSSGSSPDDGPEKEEGK